MTKNIPASVRAKLANRARDTGSPFQQLLQYYGLERFLYRPDYEGVRVKLVGCLGNARIPIQMDIAFGDVMHPAAEEREYPALLEFEAPRLRTYPRETVVAEKFHAMVYLGTLNSRMKDFYDIWLLARQFDFVGAELATAIEKTFRNRRTEMDSDPVH